MQSARQMTEFHHAGVDYHVELWPTPVMCFEIWPKSFKAMRKPDAELKCKAAMRAFHIKHELLIVTSKPGSC